MRVLLHKSGAESLEGTLSSLSNSNDLDASKVLVRKVVQECMEKIKEEPSASERSIRWELGSCWIQHLQKQETSTDNSSKNKEDSNDLEQAVKGLGKQFKFLKRREKKSNNLDGADSREQNDSRLANMNDVADKVEPNNDDLSNSNELEKLLSEEAFLRLKESGTGLHTKVCGILKIVMLLHVPLFSCFYLFIFFFKKNLELVLLLKIVMRLKESGTSTFVISLVIIVIFQLYFLLYILACVK